MSKISINNLGVDGDLIAAGHLSTIRMRKIQGEPGEEVRVWENGTWQADVTKERAQEILTERERKGYEDEISIV